MTVRGKKCFKKYDDFDSKCQGCCKVNARDFDIEARNYSNEKIETLRFKKVTLFYNWLLNKFMRTENFSPCGIDTYANYTNCSFYKKLNSPKVQKDIASSFKEKAGCKELENETIEINYDSESFKKEIKDGGSKIEKRIDIKKETVYVRIDTKIEGEELTPIEFEDHIRYLEKIATERYFKGGGFEKESGGMIIFAAENIDEADRISKNDPIIMRCKYSYQLKEWNIILKSDFM